MATQNHAAIQDFLFFFLGELSDVNQLEQKKKKKQVVSKTVPIIDFFPLLGSKNIFNFFVQKGYFIYLPISADCPGELLTLPWKSGPTSYLYTKINLREALMEYSSTYQISIYNYISSNEIQFDTMMPQCSTAC